MQVSKLGTVQPEISLHSTRDQHRKHHPCCYEQTLRTIHADIINRDVLVIPGLRPSRPVRFTPTFVSGRKGDFTQFSALISEKKT
jgi:hypothetical protein